MSYNSNKYRSTGVSPAELHIGRTLPTHFNRFIPFAKDKYNMCWRMLKMFINVIEKNLIRSMIQLCTEIMVLVIHGYQVKLL